MTDPNPPTQTAALGSSLLSSLSLSQQVVAAHGEICKALADPKTLTPQPFAAAMQIAPGANLRDLDVVVGVGVGFAEDEGDLVSDPGEGCLGDSGALVWEWAGAREPVGLLFAGGGSYTFANEISRVLTALDIELI